MMSYLTNISYWYFVIYKLSKTTVYESLASQFYTREISGFNSFVLAASQERKTKFSLRVAQNFRKFTLELLGV